MKKHLKTALAYVQKSSRKAAEVTVLASGLVASGMASATTSFTVLPAAAGTFFDGTTALGADVGIILFGIGGPVLLAVVGWNVLRGGVKKGSRL